MYFAHAFTPSTEPWNRPGRSGEPVSATTLTVIVFGVTPTSDPVSVVVLHTSGVVVEFVDPGVSRFPPPTFLPLLHAAPTSTITTRASFLGWVIWVSFVREAGERFREASFDDRSFAAVGDDPELPARIAANVRSATWAGVAPSGAVNMLLIAKRMASASSVRRSVPSVAGRPRSDSITRVSVALGQSTLTPIGSPYAAHS